MQVVNPTNVARTISPSRMTALEVMADLYCTLPEDAAMDWLCNGRLETDAKLDEVRVPWNAKKTC